MSLELPFRELVDAAPDGMIVCDERGVIVLANAEAERMFGYTRDELIGAAVEILLPLPVRTRHTHHFAGYAAQPRLRPMGSDLALRGRRKDGGEFPVEISLSPIRTAEGRLLMTAGIRDVTERQRLQSDARRAIAYLTSAVDAVNDAFVVFDEHDRVMMVNTTARELLEVGDGAGVSDGLIGLPYADVLGRALVGGLFASGGEARAALLDRWLAYHRDPVGTLEIRTSSGRYLRVVERRTAEHGTVMMFVDVTDDALRAEELRVAREQAEAASAAKTEFLSSMSHELRTPLNAVLGFAQLLERDRKHPLQPRQQEYLQHVMRGGEHLLRLIDDVLDLARIEAGRVSISSEPVAVPDLLAEVIHTLEPMAARTHASLVRDPVAADLPPVVADRTRLAQVLMNFGSNAIKYGKPAGLVRFRVARQPGMIRIAVIDDGVGIPRDKRDRIFEPFQRAGQEAGPIEGTGIGLAISKRLAGMMDARVGFESEVGVGSEFWIDVPIHREVVPRPPVRTPRPPEATLPSAARQLVVYVEDNPSNIAFMREVLADLPEVELVTATTAESGLEIIRARIPRLVIMDINLPGMSGIAAARQLHAWPETARIPIVALSAAALLDDTRRADVGGFFRYLTKPIRVDELLATLTELLARPA